MMRRKGYTLIEILIVMALFSIFLSISIPNFAFYKYMLEKQEITEFRKDLLYARNSAIVENKPYEVYFYQDKNAYSIKKGESGGTIKNKTFKYGVKLMDDEFVGYFSFNPNGTTGKSGTIHIDTERIGKYKISLTPATARINIKKQ